MWVGRREAFKTAEKELRKLYSVFKERSNRDEEDLNNAVREYQEELQKLEFKNGGQLRDYQAEGVAWMLSNYVNDRSSILADGTSEPVGLRAEVTCTSHICSVILFRFWTEMGLGKFFSTEFCCGCNERLI